METNPMMKEMMEIWKKSMEGSFQSMALMQEQSEKFTKMMVEHGNALQNEGKKFAEQWLETMKKSQQEYQNNLKSQVEKFETFFSGKEK